MTYLESNAKRIIPSFTKYPYKYGKITTPDNPCPAIKLNGYVTYEQMNNNIK